MFKKLKVQNFQSWEEAELEFSPGVNIICGLGTSGKTALISRSMKMLIDNRPLGGKNFSDFAGKKGDMVVELTTEEGDVVSLTKNIRTTKKGEKVVSKSVYSLNDEEQFSGVKDKVPDVILEKLNMSELNRQGQFDQPFLAMSSPGEVGRMINRITRLEKVDEWVKRLKTKITENNAKINNFECDVLEIDKQLKKYKQTNIIEEGCSIVDELVVVDNEFNQLIVDVDSLDELFESLCNIDQDLAPLYSAIRAEKYILRAFKIQTQFDEFGMFEKQVDKVVALTKSIDRLDSVVDLSKIKDELVVVEDELVVVCGDLAGLEEYIHCSEKINKLQQKFDVLELTREAFEIRQKEYCEVFDDVVFLEDNIEYAFASNGFVDQKSENLIEVKKDYLMKLKEVGKCPVCYQKMDEKHLKRIGAKL